MLGVKAGEEVGGDVGLDLRDPLLNLLDRVELQTRSILLLSSPVITWEP